MIRAIAEGVAFIMAMAVLYVWCFYMLPAMGIGQ
jgi:hypothetical protein